MADLDEDASLRAEPDANDVDITDEMQDFRFLSSLSQSVSYVHFTSLSNSAP